MAAAQAPTPYTGTVDITVPVRKAGISQPSVGLGTADSQHRRVDVYFSDPLPTDATVQFSVINTKGDSGRASVVQDANRRTNGTISLQGDQQTEPGFAGDLAVECRVNGEVVGQSAGFSVCAHPNGISYFFAGNRQGITDPTNPGRLFWGTLYQTAASIKSDSGNPYDLDQVGVSENIIVTRREGALQNAVNTQGKFSPALDNLGDYVGVIATSASGAHDAIDEFGTGYLVADQYHSFSCGRCDIPESFNSPKMANSGFRNFVTAAKSTTGADKYYARTRKSAYNNNDVSPGFVDYNTTQTTEIR